MVPDEFTNFFVAAAGVSGALVGLLFVAISVAPERSSERTGLQFDLRAARAFSVLSNALVISLFALIPTVNIGTTAIVVGAVSVGSCVAMVVLTLREGASGERSIELIRIAVQGAVFAYQIVVGFQISNTPHDRSGVGTLAVLVIVMALIGIARAWQLIGAREISLLKVFLNPKQSIPDGKN